MGTTPGKRLGSTTKPMQILCWWNRQENCKKLRSPKLGELLRTHYNKRVSYHHMLLTETQRQAGECESFIVKKKGKDQVCPDLRLLAWEAGGKLSRNGASYVIGL